MSPPRISVLVPLYKGASTIVESVTSLLTQDFEDLEIIVLDDGCPDNSGEVVKALLLDARESRVRLYRHNNRGLAATLNVGIGLAQAQFISRLDQDDLALPGRIRKQYQFLREHPDTALVGTWSQIYEGDTPTQRFHRHPISHEAISLNLLFDNPFVHSSVMFRKEIVSSVGVYSEEPGRQPPEDYEFWSRIARKHETANLPEVLTIYRELPGSMSRTGHHPFRDKVIQISAENLYSVLSNTYDFKSCRSLAGLYHGVFDGSNGLSSRAAERMFETVIQNLVGRLPAAQGLQEFERERSRLEKVIQHPLRERSPIRQVARWLRGGLR